MSKVVTSSLQHPSSGVANLVLAADGTVSGPGSSVLVAVKSAIFTATQTDNVAAGGNVAVTDLTITHEVADAANRVYLFLNIGLASTSGDAAYGCAVAVDGTLVGVAAADGSRVQAASVFGRGAGFTPDAVLQGGAPLSSVTEHTPGAGSKTYTGRVTNIRSGTRTLFVNRSDNDTDTPSAGRAVSTLVLMEVKV